MASPFFIIGAGRCGSTRLFRLLAPHPRIALTNEGKIVDLIHLGSRFAALPALEPAEFVIHESVRVHGIIPTEYLAVVSRVFDRHAASALVEIYQELFPHKEFTYWGDKLPDPEAALAVAEVFPDTKFAILLRDPRDVLCSYRAFGKQAHVVANNRFMTRTLPVPEFCAHFRALYEGALKYLQPHVLVHYEQLVADPRTEVDRVFAHLELEPEPHSGSLESNSELFAAHATSRNPDASVGRWRRDLPATDVREVELLLGRFMEEHGYATFG